jgi:hypothetical protein
MALFHSSRMTIVGKRVVDAVGQRLLTRVLLVLRRASLVGPISASSSSSRRQAFVCAADSFSSHESSSRRCALIGLVVGFAAVGTGRAHAEEDGENALIQV